MTIEEWEWICNKPTIGEIKRNFVFRVVSPRHPYNGWKGRLTMFAAFDERALWLSFCDPESDPFIESKFSYDQIEIVSIEEIDLDLIKKYKKYMGM